MEYYFGMLRGSCRDAPFTNTNINTILILILLYTYYHTTHTYIHTCAASSYICCWIPPGHVAQSDLPACVPGACYPRVRPWCLLGPYYSYIILYNSSVVCGALRPAVVVPPSLRSWCCCAVVVFYSRSLRYILNHFFIRFTSEAAVRCAAVSLCWLATGCIIAPWARAALYNNTAPCCFPGFLVQ